MNCPTPESLVPHALGAADLVIAEHVSKCRVCEAEVARLREGVGILRSPVVVERQGETAKCLEERVIADFVEGLLDAPTRAPVVAHLLTCARCRSLVRATGRLLAEPALAKEIRQVVKPRWRWWTVPLGAAAAVALLVVLWPRSPGDRGPSPILREPTPPGTAAPVPIGPYASVARVDRFVWSRVLGAGRYQVRLHDAEGVLLWSAETTDTVLTRPDSVTLSPHVTYFWKVAAQTGWLRWVASDLVDFQVTGSR